MLYIKRGFIITREERYQQPKNKVDCSLVVLETALYVVDNIDV